MRRARIGPRANRRGVNRLAAPFPVACLLLAALAACSSSTDVGPGASPPADDAPPDAHCKTPGALPAAPWFTDVTAESGLADVQAIRASAADLDGDGLPDLVLHWVGNARDKADAPMKRVFLNKGGRFEEITKESGIFDSRDGAGTGRLSHLSVFADVDNDGDLDLFDGTYIDASTTDAASLRDRSEIFLNDGTGHFSYAPRSAPSKGGALPTSGASFTDVDRDGIVDLFVGTFYLGDEGAGNRLYHGAGDGTFTDVSQPSGVLRPEVGADAKAWLEGRNRKPAYGVTACDVDDDGDPDLVVSAYGRSYNELWRNDGGTFTEIGQGTPFAADAIVDYAADNEFYHCWCAQPDNAGKCPPEDSKPKVGCDRFSWQPGFDDQPARNAGNTFSTACADLDNDGDMDFVHGEIRHWHIGNSSDPSQIVRNDLAGGKPNFVRVPNDDKGLLQPHGIPDWNEGNMDVAAFDFDGDGRKDIFLASSDYPDTWGLLYRQRDEGGFENVTAESGIRHYHAHGFAAVDIDGDGDLDLVVTTSPARCEGDKDCPAKPTVKVYRNDVGAARNFLQLRLHGKGAGGANAAGIGAKVTVTAGGVKQTQEVSGGYGHFGAQHDTVLTFGLGAACAVDAVEIRWPNGDKTLQRFEGVVANHLVDLFEGEPKPKYAR